MANVRIVHNVPNAEDGGNWNFSLIENRLPFLAIPTAKHSLKNGNQKLSISDSQRIGGEPPICDQSFLTCGVAEILPLMIVSYREN